ncbi:hypothetical protein AAC387_Pa01g1597 [Persea americana]
MLPLFFFIAAISLAPSDDPRPPSPTPLTLTCSTLPFRYKQKRREGISQVPSFVLLAKTNLERGIKLGRARGLARERALGASHPLSLFIALTDVLESGLNTVDKVFDKRVVETSNQIVNKPRSKIWVLG